MQFLLLEGNSDQIDRLVAPAGRALGLTEGVLAADISLLESDMWPLASDGGLLDMAHGSLAPAGALLAPDI